MRVGGFRFKPGLWPSMATLALLVLLLSLGNWQLERAQFKQELFTALDAGMLADPVPLSALTTEGMALNFRHVEVSGVFENRQWLIDNQLNAGQHGYHVVSLLKMNGSYMLINRGWIPSGDRSILPKPELPVGKVELTGLLGTPPSVGIRLGEMALNDEPVQLLHWMDVSDMQDQLGIDLYPWLLKLDADQPHGYVRKWTYDKRFGPDKHKGYAATWFSLAATLLVIYLVVNLKRIDYD